MSNDQDPRPQAAGEGELREAAEKWLKSFERMVDGIPAWASFTDEEAALADVIRRLPENAPAKPAGEVCADGMLEQMAEVLHRIISHYGPNGVPGWNGMLEDGRKILNQYWDGGRDEKA